MGDHMPVFSSCCRQTACLARRLKDRSSVDPCAVGRPALPESTHSRECLEPEVRMTGLPGGARFRVNEMVGQRVAPAG